MVLVVVMVMECNSGGVKGEGTGGDGRGGGSLSEVLLEVGRSAENAFYAFIELMSDVLGFSVNTTTKKEDVGNHFRSLGKKLEDTSNELEEVAKKAEIGDGKSVSSKNPIREAVDSAKAVLNMLKGYIESLGTVGDLSVVGDAETSAKQGVAADDDALKKAYNSLKEIVKVATGVGVKALKTGSTTLSIDSVSNKDGAKILSTSTAGAAATDVSKAAIILTAVSGEEILDSIVKSGENDAALSNNADGTTSAMSFARGGQAAHLSNTDTPKAASVAGGISLRSLVKTSKLAAGGNSKAQGGKEEVQKVGITAVNKLLGAVEEIVKKTVKSVLEKVKEEVDKARDPKAAGKY
ncbi:variable large family protein [Borrelia hispanica]|uniref:variable large family protein n=1 Tax=Borrelia hispanica TaxID=40835 RepID=UPI0006867D44|nr:variable large family protein [Borrelia hispanica]